MNQGILICKNTSKNFYVSNIIQFRKKRQDAILSVSGSWFEVQSSVVSVNYELITMSWGLNSPSPTFPVKASVLDGFCEVFGLYIFTGSEVCNGSAYF